MSDNHGILLRGLDGSNPLAFLAALGTMRTLTLALPGETVKMSWEQNSGAWRPRLWCSLATDCDKLIGAINDSLKLASGRASFAIGDNLNLPAKHFGTILRQSVVDIACLNSAKGRTDADFLAAFGSDVLTDDDGIMQDTALRTMSGAGHQHFLKFFREIIAKTDASHLQRCLLTNWDYADEGRGMNLRWDPLDDRRYALRWNDPSSDPVTTMRGANRLAIEALPLLPCMPQTGRLVTTAFEGRGARETRMLWTVWSVPIDMSVVVSLLGQVRLLRDQPQLRPHMGIAAMYASYRITTGKFRNFTPAQPL